MISPLKKDDLLSAVDIVYPSALLIRRKIHANPELSGLEFETAALIYESLKKIGLKPKYCIGKTGVVANIRNGSGKTIVLRADIDALPIEEQNDVPFKSKNRGVMHACGHDVHAACLIGAAKVLLMLKDAWRGTIILLFQPSEEVEPGGALQMIDKGIFPADADAVFGLHVTAEHTTGQVGLKPGKDFSAIMTFDASVKGRGGHGAIPENTIDPIVCTASMIMELQILISRESSPLEPAVLTIGTMNAGTKRNVIPDYAFFGGTIRTLNEKMQNRLKKRVKESLTAVARSFRANIDITFQKSYPAGFNDPALTEMAHTVLGRLIGKRNVVTRTNPTMYSEDFAYFQKIVPGVYCHLGVRNPQQKTAAGIHSSCFLPDEKAIKTGITVHSALAIDCLKKKK